LFWKEEEEEEEEEEDSTRSNNAKDESFDVCVDVVPESATKDDQVDDPKPSHDFDDSFDVFDAIASDASNPSQESEKPATETTKKEAAATLNNEKTAEMEPSCNKTVSVNSEILIPENAKPDDQEQNAAAVVESAVEATDQTKNESSIEAVASNIEPDAKVPANIEFKGQVNISEMQLELCEVTFELIVQLGHNHQVFFTEAELLKAQGGDYMIFESMSKEKIGQVSIQDWVQFIDNRHMSKHA